MRGGYTGYVTLLTRRTLLLRRYDSEDWAVGRPVSAEGGRRPVRRPVSPEGGRRPVGCSVSPEGGRRRRRRHSLPSSLSRRSLSRRLSGSSRRGECCCWQCKVSISSYRSEETSLELELNKNVFRSISIVMILII